MSKIELWARTSRPYLRYVAARLIYVTGRAMGYSRRMCVLAALMNFCSRKPALRLSGTRGGAA